jgi:MoaA/NifB/PqqE/SkfB family radical SAM enzyme
MTKDELRLLLQKQYDLVCFVDLAEITDRPSQIYKILKSCYQSEYQPQQRLVFYSQHRLSIKLLEHIQIAAVDIDISNSFILLCTPYDLSVDIALVNQQHGNDETVVLHEQHAIESSTLQDNFHIPDSICPLPWTHLAIKNQGKATACCIYSTPVGDIHNSSIVEIFNNESMQQLRSDFLAGKKPTGCNQCFDQERKGITSNRNRHLKNNKINFLSEYIDSPGIRRLDLATGNVCNFKCRICGVPASSLFAAEATNNTTDQKLISTIQEIKIQSQWANTPEFLEQFYSLIPNLINLDLYGGEPFLLKNLPNILANIVDQGHADHIQLHVNTNGSVFPKSLLPMLEKFQSVDIALSIDDIGARFELERGGSWPEVESNIKQFLALPSNKFQISFWTTVSIQNVLYLEDLWSWADQIGIKVLLGFVDRPTELNIDYMTDRARQLVIEKYQHSTRPELQQIVNRVLKSPGSDGQRFQIFVSRFDQIRKENFGLTHNEIAEAMGYVL